MILTVKIKREYIIVLTAAAVGVCTALGVGAASRVLLNEPLDTAVDNGVQSGLVAALVILGTEYVRENLL
jgi:hypothetical protein